MTRWLVGSTIIFSLSTSTLSQESGVDYSLLDHKISVSSLRGGNQDESGTNEYFFKAKIYGIKNPESAIAVDLKTAENIEKELGEFGDFTVDVLKDWDASNATADGLQLEVTGDLIRLLVSEAMRKFEIKEKETAIKVSLELFERNKRFMFFGEDTLVGKTEYYPVPASQYQIPARTNLKLEISEKTGTRVVIKVTYAKPLDQGAEKTADAAAATQAAEPTAPQAPSTPKQN